MRPSQEKIIKDNFSELVECMAVWGHTMVKNLTMYLRSKEQISDRDVTKILDRPQSNTPTSMATDLLNVIRSNRGPIVFGCLYEAFQKYELWVAMDILDSNQSYRPLEEERPHQAHSGRGLRNMTERQALYLQNSLPSASQNHGPALSSYAQAIDDDIKNLERINSPRSHDMEVEHDEAQVSFSSPIREDFFRALDQVRNLQVPLNALDCMLLAALEAVAGVDDGGAWRECEDILAAANEFRNKRIDEYLNQDYTEEIAMTQYIDKLSGWGFDDQTNSTYFQIWLTAEKMERDGRGPGFNLGPKILAVDSMSIDIRHVCNKEIAKSWPLKSLKRFNLDGNAEIMELEFEDGTELEARCSDPHRLRDSIKDKKKVR